MRDLASRLRAVLDEDKRRRAATEGGAADRELSYEPDVIVPLSIDIAQAAADLGGRVHRGRTGAFVVVDRVWDATDFHGTRRLESYTLDASAPLGLFDSRVSNVQSWADRPVFFDIETTGLSGGAGTVAFLVGCGWFEDSGFRVRQLLMTGPAGERDMLDELASIFADASLLVTYNGRSFDVPTMETRWAFHRCACATDDLPHFDMLPAARRLWGRRARRGEAQAMPRAGAFRAPAPREDDESTSCSLSTLERSVLGFHRLGDVPGFEIPTRYFQFLRTGDARAVKGVLEHNQHDLVSLAAVTVHALHLASDGPEACRAATEQAGLGRLYERAGELDRAARAYAMAGESDDVETAVQALSRLAVLERRSERHHEAVRAWQQVIERCGSRDALRPLARRAAEALAIHHEHRAGDPATAKTYAETLERQAPERDAAGVRHRLARLERKIEAARNTMGGPEAAHLFES